ncbi:hypothetical protein BGHDH14_bgh01825 [Blumeria hordei DH14]|uniref:At2g23090-like zinc-binding domain-containing protein n=1 Tax=Blumeria graminis f. sp. hordei (strain DH14) TaxID=546991 RepID=N1JDQ2_BLUG1|nr:hypothetical protein BGHDH14_bgh01825 [Blumeria hordei DH14]
MEGVWVRVETDSRCISQPQQPHSVAKEGHEISAKLVYSSYLAEMGNGAKAASKRDRKDKDVKVAKSQLKVNEQARDIQCNICKSTFLKTTRAPALTEHATNKHSKTLEICFPGYSAK